MIIWGSTGREVQVGQGQFYCPQCQSQQHFFHNRLARYFTLYFIPLFPIGNHGEFIVCGGCGGQFSMDVLQYKPPSSSERLAHALRADLDAGMPLHMAQQKLLSGGMAQADAEQFIAWAAEEPTRHCARCNFRYRHTVGACMNCGGRLA
jgi:hypothetical protein